MFRFHVNFLIVCQEAIVSLVEEPNSQEEFRSRYPQPATPGGFPGGPMGSRGIPGMSMGQGGPGASMGRGFPGTPSGVGGGRAPASSGGNPLQVTRVIYSVSTRLCLCKF